MLEPFGGVEVGTGPLSKHIPLSRLDYPSDLVIFANIRNPVDRAVSLFSNMKFVTQVQQLHNMEFDEWLFGEFLPFSFSQHDYLFVDGRTPNSISPIPVEIAGEFWKELVRETFGVDTVLPQLNVTQENAKVEYTDPLAKYSTSRRSEMIERINRKEWWAFEQYS